MAALQTAKFNEVPYGKVESERDTHITFLVRPPGGGSRRWTVACDIAPVYMLSPVPLDTSVTCLKCREMLPTLIAYEETQDIR